MDSPTASRWSRARPIPYSLSAAGASALRRGRWMAAMSSTGGSFSSLWGAAPRITPPLLSGLGTSPGSSAPSISGFPRTRRVCPSPRRLGSDGDARHSQPRHAARERRLAHLDDGYDRAILVQNDEGSAQVVRLGHRGTHP